MDVQMMSAMYDLLRGKDPSIVGMGRTLIRDAHVNAYYRMHSVCEPIHVLWELLTVAEVTQALSDRGLHEQDVEAVLDQLLEELPVGDDSTPWPASAPSLLESIKGSYAGPNFAITPMVSALANALPRELGFLRAPLADSARELGATLDMPLLAKDGSLTFEAWEPQLARLFARAQHFVDEKSKGWSIGVVMVLLLLIVRPPIYEQLTARGIDHKALLHELDETLPKVNYKMRARPEDWVPALTPALYATIVRAERLAAKDRTNVKLPHLLAAMRANSFIAHFIDRIS